MELKIAEELERKAKRQKVLVQINILEGYRSNVRQAIQRLEKGKNMYRQGHANYTPSWQGESRNAYEQMAAELNQTGNKKLIILVKSSFPRLIVN